MVNLQLLLFVTVGIHWVLTEEHPPYGDFKPEHYDLNLKIDGESPEYSGFVSIKLRCKNPTNIIQLNANSKLGLTIEENSVRVYDLIGEDMTPLEILRTYEDDENQLFVIEMQPLLECEDKSYKLDIPFTGKLWDGLLGLNKAHFHHYILLVFDFKRTYARNVFPCFDDPAFKATFQLSIERKAYAKTFSNTKIEKWGSMEEEGWMVDLYKPTAPLSTFQISFVVSEIPLSKISQQIDGYDITLYVDAQSENRLNEKNFIIGDIFLDICGPLAKRLKFLKLDFILLPIETKIIMETQGLTVRREGGLYRARELGADHSLMYLSDTLARTAYASIVSPTSWSSQWLIISLAKYRAFTLLPEKFSQDQLILLKLSVMNWDSLVDTKKVSNIFTDTKSLEQAVPEHLSDKGHILLTMLQMTIGKDYFEDSVNTFLSKNVLKAVSKDDLWAVIDTKLAADRNWFSKCLPQTGVQLLPEDIRTAEVMDSWTEQGGYPILTVKRKGTNVHVTQDRYYSESLWPFTAKKQNCWWIPLTWTKSDETSATFENTQPRAWLGCERTARHPPSYILKNVKRNQWIVFNNHFSGLYRVDYDSESWEAIIKVLKDVNTYQRIPCPNRILLIEDALTLSFQEGYQTNFEIASQLFFYLRHETGTSCLIVWKKFFDGIGKHQKGLENTSLFTDFQTFLRLIIRPMYKERFPSKHTVSGYMHKNVNADNYMIKLQIHMASCQALIKECVDQANELMEHWKAINYKFNRLMTSFGQGLLMSVLCTVIRESRDNENVNYLINAVTIENPNRYWLVNSLICIRNSDLMERVLDWCTGNSAEPETEGAKIAVLSGLLGGPYTYREAASYFIKNFDRIRSFFRAHINSFLKILICQTDKKVLEQVRTLIRTKFLQHVIKDEEWQKCESAYDEKQRWLAKNEDSLKKLLNSFFLGELKND